MVLRFAFAAAFVVGLAAPGYAGPVYATGTPTFNVVTDTNNVMSASNLGNAAGAPDGNSASIVGIDANGANNDVFTLTFAFAPGQTNGALSIYTGSTGWNGLSLDVVNVAWTGGATPGSQSFSTGTFSMNSQSTTYVISGLTWSTDFTSIVVTFQDTQGNNKLATFDGISTLQAPEPGTSALFALGTVGLSAAAWRRRRRRCVSARSA
jgi:hypothetical protein